MACNLSNFNRLEVFEQARLLITGATGFVGRYIVRQALEKSYQIHAIVRNSTKAKALFGEKIKIYQLEDFNNRQQLRKIIEVINPQYVIHLIGIIQEKKADTFERVHYEYSKVLYETLKDFSVKKIIHMSALGVGEEAPSKYHITKLKAEKELIKTGISYVILRPSFIIGPEQLLFLTLKKFLNKSPFLVFPDIGNYYFQPVDVRDVAECFIKAINYNQQGIFELCGDERVTLKDIVNDFGRLLRKKIYFIRVPKLLIKIFASEQYKMMWTDNVCQNSDIKPISILLQRQPIPYKEQISYAARF